MKTIYLITQLLLLSCTLQGQFYYEIGDTLTVVAKSGLHLRDSSSSTSLKLGIVPFGGKVIAQGFYEGGYYEFGNRTGRWLKVKYKGLTGYVFSGFVTTLKIPVLDFAELEDGCYQLGWFEKLIRNNVDSLVYKGDNTYKGFDQDSKDWSRSLWEIYSDETIISHLFWYESEELIIESSQIGMNDILNIVEYYISKVKEKCADYPMLNEEEKEPDLNILRDEYGRIKSIECRHLKFLAEKSRYKTSIRVILWES